MNKPNVDDLLPILQACQVGRKTCRKAAMDIIKMFEDSVPKINTCMFCGEPSVNFLDNSCMRCGRKQEFV